MARVLIIDDEDQAREMLRQWLERSGYEVAEAENGDVGVRLFRENPADLIITDILMPEKEGLETIIDLRREKPDVKIIAISGGGKYCSQDYLEVAEKFGANHSFAKPVDLHELLECIRELLDDSAA